MQNDDINFFLNEKYILTSELKELQKYTDDLMRLTGTKSVNFKLLPERIRNISQMTKVLEQQSNDLQQLADTQKQGIIQEITLSQIERQIVDQSKQRTRRQIHHISNSPLNQEKIKLEFTQKESQRLKQIDDEWAHCQIEKTRIQQEVVQAARVKSDIDKQISQLQEHRMDSLQQEELLKTKVEQTQQIVMQYRSQLNTSDTMSTESVKTDGRTIKLTYKKKALESQIRDQDRQNGILKEQVKTLIGQILKK